ncbi:MAG: DoxX family protein [Jiangellales bacterium]
MEIALWALQVILALAIGGAGVAKLLKSKEELAPRMTYVTSFTATQVKLIGIVEVAAGLGIILPALTGIAPILTPIAAVGIVLIMIGAAITHVVRKEPALIVPNIVLGAAAAFVAWGRFGEYAIA